MDHATSRCGLGGVDRVGMWGLRSVLVLCVLFLCVGRAKANALLLCYLLRSPPSTILQPPSRLPLQPPSPCNEPNGFSAYLHPYHRLTESVHLD